MRPSSLAVHVCACASADYHKLLRHEFDDVQVEPDYSCLVDNGCSSFAMAIRYGSNPNIQA